MTNIMQRNALYRGSAVANTISQFSLAGILYAYIIWKGLHKATWGGECNICIKDSDPAYNQRLRWFPQRVLMRFYSDEGNLNKAAAQEY